MLREPLLSVNDKADPVFSPLHIRTGTDFLLSHSSFDYFLYLQSSTKFNPPI